MDMPMAKPFQYWPTTVTRTQLWVSPKLRVLTSATLGKQLDVDCMLIQVKRSHVHCLGFGCGVWESAMKSTHDRMSQ